MTKPSSLTILNVPISPGSSPPKHQLSPALGLPLCAPLCLRWWWADGCCHGPGSSSAGHYLGCPPLPAIVSVLLCGQPDKLLPHNLTHPTTPVAVWRLWLPSDLAHTGLFKWKKWHKWCFHCSANSTWGPNFHGLIYRIPGNIPLLSSWFFFFLSYWWSERV